MLAVARQQHGRHGEFLLGDATRLNTMPELRANSFAGVVFLLSIQDIDPLDAYCAWLRGRCDPVVGRYWL